MTRTSYQAKDVLFRQAEPITQLFELRSGQVKLLASLPDGREQILRLGVPGHLLGFESLEQGVYDYTAQAVSPVQACAIDQQAIQSIITENPHVLRNIAKRLAEELKQAEDMIITLGMKHSEERVASFLLSLAKDIPDLSKNFPLFLKRHEIAKILGLTTETVSRVLTQLQRDAIIIAPRGCIRVLDHSRLRTMSGASEFQI